jgi:hypothetical protein
MIMSAAAATASVTAMAIFRLLYENLRIIFP